MKPPVNIKAFRRIVFGSRCDKCKDEFHCMGGARSRVTEGQLGGSVAECLPLAQGVGPRIVSHQASYREPASPSAYVSASLCVSLVNK